MEIFCSFAVPNTTRHCRRSYCLRYISQRTEKLKLASKTKSIYIGPTNAPAIIGTVSNSSIQSIKDNLGVPMSSLMGCHTSTTLHLLVH